MTDTGWRLTYVYRNRCGHGYTVTYEKRLMTHAEAWALANKIEAKVKAHPAQWPLEFCVGMEFVDGEKRL